MFNIAHLEGAMARWMGSVALDQPWTASLDEMAAAVGAKGCALYRQPSSGLAFLTSSAFDSLQNDLRNWRTSENALRHWQVSDGNDGFMAHAAPWRAELFKSDTLYREYLAPVAGVAHRAQAVLAETGEKALRFIFLRTPAQGVFEPTELEQLDRIRSTLQATVTFAKFKDRLSAEQQAVRYRERGELVIFWGADGRLTQESCDEIRRCMPWARIANRRLSASLSAEQQMIDTLVANAVAGSSGSATLSIPHSAQKLFLMSIPLRGVAKSVMGEASAMGVVIDRSKPTSLGTEATTQLRAMGGLTAREAEITGLVAVGLSAEKIATRTGVAIGTVRNQIKTAMQKFGVHSQVELAALVARLL